jgi:hypothetical protein
MNRESIKKQILIRIDEISPFDSVDIIPNDLIDGLLDESAEDVLMKLPIHLLPTSVMANVVFVEGLISLKITLPTDFLRLIKLVVDGWIKPIHKLYTEEDTRFSLQYTNKYLRGTPNRPIGFLVSNAASPQKDILLFGKLDTNLITEDVLYCKKLAADYIPDNILEALFYVGAFKVLLAMEKPEQAKVAMAQFENFIKRNITT